MSLLQGFGLDPISQLAAAVKSRRLARIGVAQSLDQRMGGVAHMLPAQPRDMHGIAVAKRLEDLAVLHLDLRNSDIGHRYTDIRLDGIAQRIDDPAQMPPSARG